ncbi:MAG: ABC transporter permease [Oscillospiraceae bacterium]
MSIFENISLAFSSLRANKMRALLTMLGIIIGIGSVIAIMTLGDSLTSSVSDSLAGLGANNITLSLQSKEQERTGAGGLGAAGGASIDESNLLTDAMMEDLKQAFPEELKAVSISTSVGSGQTTHGKKYANLSLTGVNEDYFSANTLTVEAGRFLNKRDNDGAKKVAMVSNKLAENMFGSQNPLGQQITIAVGEHVGLYTIVGVYEYEASSMMGGQTVSDQDLSTPVYIPLSTAQQITRISGYQSATLMTNTGVNSTEFAEQAAAYMEKYYSRNQEYGVSLTSMESMMETITEMLGTIELAIAAIAAISLLVGGIGVMNIMMVSITERTREIGTR